MKYFSARESEIKWRSRIPHGDISYYEREPTKIRHAPQTNFSPEGAERKENLQLTKLQGTTRDDI